MINLKNLRAFAIIAALFCGGAHAEILFYNSFDNGFEADYCRGSGAAVHHDSLKLTTGREGGGLWCKPNQYIRYETDGNIDFTEGTISLWIKPNYKLPDFRAQYGGDVQCIFSMRIRTDDMMELRLRNDKTPQVLWLMTGDKDKKRSNINFPLSGWDDKKWHKVQVSWRQPSRLAVKVDDLEPVEINNAVLPKLPAAMMYDIFFGTNSNQTSLFRLEHFDGVIDNICISDKWFTDCENYGAVQKDMPRLPSDVAAPEKFGKNTHAVNLYVKPQSQQWQRQPIEAVIELDEKWLKLTPRQKRAAVNGFRVVRFDSKSGKPVVFNNTLLGEEKYFVPFVVDDDVYYKQKATLRFVHNGNDDACYSFSYSLEPRYEKPFPLEIPMVGNGDMMRVGRKDTIGTLCSGISGVFDAGDIDGDGDLDLWMNSGTLKTRGCTNLQVGHYYYENISAECGVKNVFAPGRLIIRDNTPDGYVSGVVVPVFCDVNSDGRQDMLMLGRTSRQWWQWHYENGGVVIDKINNLEFSGAPLDKEYKTCWYDWDGDGLGDVIASGLLDLNDESLVPVMNIFKNIGTPDKPLIDTNNPIVLDIGLPQLQWQYRPTDWDCDGDVDFVSAGFIHELYFHENIGGGKFAAPKRITTYDRREINITQALINIVIIDWDGDGDKDLLYGCEDGIVGFMENIAAAGTTPKLKQPVRLAQIMPVVDAGSISVPVITDWDCDGDNDMLAAGSNTMQYYENKGSNQSPLWAWPVDMTAGDSLIELRAGDDGSVQGLEELCWQYNNAEVADWDCDGLKDLIISGIRGEHLFYKNIGTPSMPRLAAGELIMLDSDKPLYPQWLTFKPKEGSLVTVWRTKPKVLDWNGDGLPDYITLDHEGTLALYPRGRGANGALTLGSPQHIFSFDSPYSQALVWNRAPGATAGRSGRTVVNIVDWDNDGDWDLVYDNINARYYENTTGNEEPLFVDRGDLVKQRLANHNSGPHTADFDGDGWCDLFIGSETGRVFYFSRPYIEGGRPEVISFKP